MRKHQNDKQTRASIKKSWTKFYKYLWVIFYVSSISNGATREDEKCHDSSKCTAYTGCYIKHLKYKKSEPNFLK